MFPGGELPLGDDAVSSRPIVGPRVLTWLLKAPTLSFVAGEDPQPELPQVPDPRRGAVVGLVVTVLLILGGVFLVHVLSRTAKLQDCVMSGRTNCAPIASGAETGG